MITYQLNITNSHEDAPKLWRDSPDYEASYSRDPVYLDACSAADVIEMKHSEYFTWDDDAQESLSRSTAINLAEKEIQKYIHVKEYLWWIISNDADSSRVGLCKQEDV